MFRLLRNSSIKLGEWNATAICSNDILGSALFVTGITIIYAGIYAPLIFILVAAILYCYKTIYSEIVEALPVNGGVYTLYLNAASKSVASIAGIVTFLSFTASGVISAKTAIAYVHIIFPIPILIATILVIAIFGMLVLSGLKESAFVASVIFFIHIIVLSLFIGYGLAFYLDGHSYLIDNLHHTSALISNHGGLLFSLFLAFSVCLLSISGFETAANFVEQQKVGIYAKTLKNMLIAFAFFNPLMTLIVLNSLKYQSIINTKDILFANVANVIGGPFFEYIVVVDVFLVLAGGVLTAYIGVCGLLSRMASNGSLPNILNKQNKNKSYPLIIISFFVISSSVLLFTKGDLLNLAGVDALTYLGELSLYAIGNLILKKTRQELRRKYHAPILLVFIALAATVIGIDGNIQSNINNLRFSSFYFIPLLLIVIIMLYQDNIVLFLLKVFSKIKPIEVLLVNYYKEITDGRFIAFVHNYEKIFRMLHYIESNETGTHVTFVHCKCDEHKISGEGKKEIEEIIFHLQEAGAFTHLKIDVQILRKPFGPKAIDEISKKLKIKENRILIGSIHNFHPYDYADLGGVRVIF